MPCREDTCRSRIQAIEMWYRRKAEVVARMDRVLNEDIRRRLRIEAVLGEADKKKKRGNATKEVCEKRIWGTGAW